MLAFAHLVTTTDKMRLNAIAFFLLGLLLSIVAGEPITCSCDANLGRLRARHCDQWCGERCLTYLREELLIMDLADCLNSTVRFSVQFLSRMSLTDAAVQSRPRIRRRCVQDWELHVQLQECAAGRQWPLTHIITDRMAVPAMVNCHRIVTLWQAANIH